MTLSKQLTKPCFALLAAVSVASTKVVLVVLLSPASRLLVRALGQLMPTQVAKYFAACNEIPKSTSTLPALPL